MCRRKSLLVAIAAGFLQVWQPPVFAQNPASGNAQTSSPPSKRDVIEIVPDQSVQVHGSSETADGPPEKIPNFATCAIDELRQVVPELKGLQPAQNQLELQQLLQEIGAKTAEIVRRTPNLISHETVVSGLGFQKTRQDFSYLVLTHAEGSDHVVLDEFRTDLATGEKMQTEDFEKQMTAVAATAPSVSGSSNIEEQLRRVPAIQSVGSTQPSGPLAQGFANAWSHFYPLNQPQAQFRYLGQQKIDGHHTQVVAFTEKPESVRMPGVIRLGDRTAKIFFQGVAWVDATDFRIVRLRTDLLNSALGLKRLSADIEFEQVRLEDVASPLWLPRQVVVNSRSANGVLNEIHRYSSYRLFRTRTRIVFNP